VQKVVKYQLLGETLSSQLEAKVNAQLNAGWSLYGSPMCWAATRHNDSEWMIYQAMVKYEPSAASSPQDLSA